METTKHCKVVFEIDKSTFDGVMFLVNKHDRKQNDVIWEQMCKDEVVVPPTIFKTSGLSETEMSLMIVSFAVATVKGL